MQKWVLRVHLADMLSSCAFTHIYIYPCPWACKHTPQMFIYTAFLSAVKLFISNFYDFSIGNYYHVVSFLVLEWIFNGYTMLTSGCTDSITGMFLWLTETNITKSISNSRAGKWQLEWKVWKWKLKQIIIYSFIIFPVAWTSYLH